MKIVITTDCFLPRWDGVARFLQELLPKLALDAEITVFAPRFEGEIPIVKGVRVTRFPLRKTRFGDIQFSKPDRDAMVQAIAEADVVFNQTLGPVGSKGIKIAYKLGKPIVSYVHNVEWELASNAVRRCKGFIRWFVRLWARSHYNKCSLLLVPSKEIEDLLSNNKVQTKKEVVMLGVDADHFVPTKSKAAAKKKINISSNKRVVGYCGRIAREKDLPTLYKAFEKLKKKPKPILLVVGEGLEKELPKIKNVMRVGRQDDVVPFLQAMDVYVLSSLTETSSLSTMEAMACGVPVVVTPVGSLSRYVADGKNGFLFPRGDSDSLAEKLDLLLDNTKMRRAMGQEARKTMADGYDLKTAIKKIREVFKHVS